jgi:uncharacterized membrane protein
VLFLGLAATFATLAATPERMKWPLIPAAVLAVLGLSLAIQSTVTFGAMDYITALVPLVAGLYLLYYAFHSRRQPAHGQGRYRSDETRTG